MAIQTSVTVRFRTAGFHQWEDAPHSVAFLKHEHRHIFHVGVTARVTHSNRQLEFFDLCDRAKEVFEHVMPRQLSRLGPHYGERSCETLASELLMQLRSYRIDVVAVTVSEDGENEGLAEYIND